MKFRVLRNARNVLKISSLEFQGKVHPRTDHEGPEVKYRYSSTISLTSALGGVGGRHHPLAAVLREKDRVPILLEAGWTPGPVWTGAENLAPTGFRSLDRPARSELLYQLHYTGLRFLELVT
jgi:hypothetical protein